MNRGHLCKYLTEHGKSWLELASATDKELKAMAYGLAVVLKDFAVRNELGKEYVFFHNGNKTTRPLTPIDYECERETH